MQNSEYIPQIGDIVRITYEHSVFLEQEGTIENITPQGRLIIVFDNGFTDTFYLEDVLPNE